MRRAVLPLVLMLLFAGRAEALSLRDIVELTKAGVGEEVLLALIEVTQDIYAINNETILGLKEAGVTEKVLVAIVRSGRAPRPQAKPAILEDDNASAYALKPTPPPTITVEQRNSQSVEVVAPPPVHVPVFVPVATRPVRRGDDRPPRREEPEFWGFGGKLRPDAWKPSPKDERPKPPPCLPSSFGPRCQP